MSDMQSTTDKKLDKIGQILVRLGYIGKEDLRQALEAQPYANKKLGEIFLEKRLLTEKQLIEALSQEYQLSVVNASEVAIDPRVQEMFSYKMLQEHTAMPLRIEDGHLVVAVNDPLNFAVLQDLKNISGLKLRLTLSTADEINTSLNKYFGSLHSAEEAIREITVANGKKSSQDREPSLQELEFAALGAPIVRVINSIIEEAIKQNASDIHFEPQRNFMRVRLRIDGVLYAKVKIPKELQDAIVSRIKIISGIDIAERRKPQDGRMSVAQDGKEFDIRVSSLPDIFGEKVVLRLLDKKSVILPLGSLGLFTEELQVIKTLIEKPYGIILVTGPTGSGKTTTLYSLLNSINMEARNIVTVEDPVEYELDGINQTSINVLAGYTFATAIRHILRQDPDVIMIGEIRDQETAEIAIQAALTGHLVFSTIHTNNAPGVITRLIDMNIEPFLISSALIGVIAQRLVRKLCLHCKQEYVVSEEIKEKHIPQALLSPEILKLSKPVGCKKCYHLGYSGRTAIFELFTMDEDIRSLVLKKTPESEIARMVTSKGMRTLRLSGIKKAIDKITSLEEVVRVTSVEKE